MQNESAVSGPAIYTVGHSNHAFEVFLDLLRAQAIQLVADVRSSPYARYATHFNKEALESRLVAESISYRFVGHVLGGRPQDPVFYDSDGYVLYSRIAASPGFQQELSRLLEQAVQVRTALLCGEEDPSECHRRLLVGRVASERGYGVFHLRGDGWIQSEEQLAKDECFQRTKGQLSLFDMEGERPWKSTRSVSRDRRPSGS